MASSLFKWLSLSFMFFLGKNNEAADRVHPLYITVTEIDYNAKDKTLEISCKIFTNDFEAALEKVYHTKTDLSNPKDKSATDKLVSDYIMKHFQIKADGKPVALEFVGSEKETDATWSYFQVSNIPSVKRIDVMNNLLYETFEGQMGIMHVTVSGNRKSEKLTNPDANITFEF